MDSEPFEYTKFPGPASKAAPAKPKPSPVSPVPAGAAAAAAVVVIAAVFAAGPLLFPTQKAPPAPAPAASAQVLEAPPMPAPVAAPVEAVEARPSSPLPIAFGAEGARGASRPAVQTPPLPAAATARQPASAKPGRKPFRPPSLNGGGSSWGGKETGPVVFTPGGGTPPETAPTGQTLETASWSATMRSRPIGVRADSNGKIRSDYHVDRTERPDFRVDKTPRPDYAVKNLPERADFRVDKTFRQNVGGTGPRIKPVGGGGGGGGDGCVDCEEAGEAAGIAVGHDGRVVTGGVGAGGGGAGGAGAAIGKLTYVGTCAEGQLYRLTNTTGRRLGSTTLIGDSGEVWDVRALQPGESSEIRSRGLISSLSTAP